jgi:hypothetical protein
MSNPVGLLSVGNKRVHASVIFFGFPPGSTLGSAANPAQMALQVKQQEEQLILQAAVSNVGL